ncbi:MAG: ribosome assembly cofactor RimP [Bacteroidales bacterium]|nr:ribosome assembly cofactor RimP [Bacteroidales bacterium]
MIDKNKIEQIINEYITERDMFLVSLKVSTANRITVLADTMKGITIDECAELHRFLEKQLDRNIEDFELQVSSPGLDSPFRVIQQYYRNEGNMIELTDINGEKFAGKLKNVSDGGFELETVIKNRDKTSPVEELSFNYDQVKTAKTVLTINKQ